MITSLNNRALRDALGSFATGVTVVTGIKPGGEPAGVTVNSFASVSLEPPLISWCLQNSSSSLTAFEQGRPFCVNILAAHQQRIALQFAGKAPDKFAQGQRFDTAGPPPRLSGCLCRLDCVVEDWHPAGDHRLIIGRVVGIERAAGSPLVFHGGRFGRFDLDPSSTRVETWESYFGDWF